MGLAPSPSRCPRASQSVTRAGEASCLEISSAGPGAVAYVAGESWALSSEGRVILGPWECGSLPLSAVLWLKNKTKPTKTKRRLRVCSVGCFVEVFAVALPGVSKRHADSCMVVGVGLFFFFLSLLCALTVI